MRPRDAPSDSRMPSSRWRETPRASCRLATLAQPIIRISPKAKKIGEKTSSASPASSGDVPCLGLSLMDAGRPGIVSRSDRPDAHTVSAAVADSGDIPGFSRPTTSMGISSWSPRIVIAELSGECEWRPVIGRADAEASKAVGHDADDLVRQSVDAHAAADHHRIAREQLVPPAVTEHDHRPAGRALVVIRRQRASERSLDPQHLEEVSGDEGGGHRAALDACPDGAQHGEGIGEDGGLAANRVVFGPRERQPRIRAGGCRPFHGKQLARVPYRIDAKKEDVVDREHDVISPRPSATVATMVSAARGARRNVRNA